jgi:hypothetical protein
VFSSLIFTVVIVYIFIAFHYSVTYVYLLLGKQKSPENRQQLNVEESPLPREVQQDLDNCSLSKYFLQLN